MGRWVLGSIAPRRRSRERGSGHCCGARGQPAPQPGKNKKKKPTQKEGVVNAEMAGGFLGANLHIAGRIFPFESPSFLIFFFFWRGISWLSLGILVVGVFLLFLLLFLRWNWSPGRNLIGNIWGLLLNIPGDRKQKLQKSRRILK